MALDWNGLNKWQEWVVGIGGSLAATLIIWLFTKVLRKPRERDNAGLRRSDVPVMTQTFQPTINIHPAVSVTLDNAQRREPEEHKGTNTPEHQGVRRTDTPLPSGQARAEAAKSVLRCGDFGVHWADHCDQGINGTVSGVLISVKNCRVTNLKNFRVEVRQARSFDSAHSRFREGFGFAAIRLLALPTLNAGDLTPRVWLLRVNGDELEVGSSVGQGKLLWPRGDENKEQLWLLNLAIEAENFTPWNFDASFRWTRGSEYPDLAKVWLDGYPASH